MALLLCPFALHCRDQDLSMAQVTSIAIRSFSSAKTRLRLKTCAGCFRPIQRPHHSWEVPQPRQSMWKELSSFRYCRRCINSSVLGKCLTFLRCVVISRDRLAHKYRVFLVRIGSLMWPYSKVNLCVIPSLPPQLSRQRSLIGTTSFVEMADVLRFSANITEETLIASTRLLVYAYARRRFADQNSHNQFRPDTAFPQIDVLSDGFEQLCAIIAKYNVQSHFRLRLLHRHMTIPEGQILLGTSMTERLGYWTRPTHISDIDLQNIHGHIFLLDPASCKSEGEMRNALFPSWIQNDSSFSFRKRCSRIRSLETMNL